MLLQGMFRPVLPGGWVDVGGNIRNYKTELKCQNLYLKLAIFEPSIHEDFSKFRSFTPEQFKLFAVKF